MELHEKIEALSRLGSHLSDISKQNSSGLPASLTTSQKQMLDGARQVRDHNPWFTFDQVLMALGAIGAQLKEEKMRSWLSRYPELEQERKAIKVGVIMAGNIPAVGFHDLLCVVLAGHVCIGKPSRKEGGVMQHIASMLIDIEPSFKEVLLFSSGQLRQADRVIATGSDNTARYFEYQYRTVPTLIRKNRNGIAILNGQESSDELDALRTDVFSYFGLGCRNVSKLYLPENYDLAPLVTALVEDSMDGHGPYQKNLGYQRALMSIEKIPFIDTGSILLREHPGIASPIGVLHYEYYHNTDALLRALSTQSDKIQCMVGKYAKGAVAFGQTQYPELWDYADHIDTLRFLMAG
jgi:hypothetical protein